MAKYTVSENVYESPFLKRYASSKKSVQCRLCGQAVWKLFWEIKSGKLPQISN